jgi:ABC-2 type transport system ATP-binding protein
MTSAITATGLRESFGHPAAKPSLTASTWRSAGTTFSLLGPNRAGKTTTVQIMSTLVHADGGETVEVRGHTSYGDIAIRRSRLASGTGEEGQP